MLLSLREAGCKRPDVPEGEIPEPREELEATTQTTYSAEEFNVLMDLAAQQYERAERWFFRYLDIFFVPMTKIVLRWVAEHSPTTRNESEAFWKAVITEPAQRDTILDVLIANGLIQETGGTISVTDVGQRFLDYMDSLAQSPSPA